MFFPPLSRPLLRWLQLLFFLDLHGPTCKTLPPKLADETLTELPFFPYTDCRLAGYSLPPKPDSLCDLCWDGALGAHAAWLFDAADGDQERKKWSYWASQKKLQSNANKGCAWCRVVYWEFSSFLHIHERQPACIDVEVGLHFGDGAPPTGMHMMTIHYNGRHGRRYAYTLNDGEIKFSISSCRREDRESCC